MSLGDFLDSKSIFVGGNGTRVSGSKRIQRDLSNQINWWQLRSHPAIRSIPPGRKWCSQHPTQTPPESLLASSPDAYWEMLGWLDKSRFKRDPARRDQLHPICNDCLARRKRILERMRKDEAAMRSKGSTKTGK